ncbi:MFS transporter [Nocardioides houyundeii]|uniref:MFS transporter n=1 Tax=Nocardioides houyundeii TaxID=2045452 RepID=UPI000C77BBCF|nr:MFS transporter [Nocardioides houyundeii]
MRAAFAQAGFKRLFTGLSASMLGDSIMLLVLSMWVKTLTDSNAMAGLTFLFMCIPAVFGPLLGVLMDRVKRKPLLVWGNVASAVAVLPLLAVRDEGDVWLIWLVAFFYGISFVVLPAGLNGLLKEMMPGHLLVEANSSIQTVKESYRLFGPLLGAALFAGLGGWAVALIDAVTFLVAAAVIATIPLLEEEPVRDESPMWVQLSSGVRHIVADHVLKHLLFGFGLTLLVLGFMEASIYALLDGFEREPTYAGVLVSAQGVGAIAGGLCSSWLIKRHGEVAVAILGLTVLAVSIGGMALSPHMWVVLVFAAVCGVSLPLMMVSYMTLLQRRTPHALMGRVSTAAEVVLTTPQAISLGMGSLLVVLVDWRIIFALMAVVIAVAAAYVAVLLRAELGPARSAEEQTQYEPAGSAMKARSSG